MWLHEVPGQKDSLVHQAHFISKFKILSMSVITMAMWANMLECVFALMQICLTVMVLVIPQYLWRRFCLRKRRPLQSMMESTQTLGELKDKLKCN
jgi:hypothetical protein